MLLEEYRERRISAQKQIIKHLEELFEQKGVVSIHQFGSFARGTSDELSDFDMWFTFKDEDLGNIVTERDHLFRKIGKVVIKYEPPQNAPLGGTYSMVIHEIEGDLYHVDYYLSALSKTNIRPDAVLVYGDDTLPRGEWLLHQERPFLNTPSSRVDFLICMSFIGIKYVVRKGKPFMDFLVEQYNINRKEHFSQLKELTNGYGFNTIKLILDRHYPYANDNQKMAIDKIKEYLGRITDLYT